MGRVGLFEGLSLSYKCCDEHSLQVTSEAVDYSLKGAVATALINSKVGRFLKKSA